MSASDLYSAELLTKAKEFWYAFDNRYNTGDTEVNQLLLNCNLMKENPTQGGQPIPNLDWMFFSRDRMHTDPLNYEKSFTADILPYKKGIITLANDQSETSF